MKDILLKLANENYRYLAKDTNGDVWAFKSEPTLFPDGYWDTVNNHKLQVHGIVLFYHQPIFIENLLSSNNDKGV